MTVHLLRQKRGTIAAIARALGMRGTAVTQWRVIPAEYVVKIEAVTGIPRELLRPDLYRAEAVAEAQHTADV